MVISLGINVRIGLNNVFRRLPLRERRDILWSLRLIKRTRLRYSSYPFFSHSFSHTCLSPISLWSTLFHQDLSTLDREAEEKSKLEKAQALKLYKEKEKLDQAKKVIRHHKS